MSSKIVVLAGPVGPRLVSKPKTWRRDLALRFQDMGLFVNDVAHPDGEATPEMILYQVTDADLLFANLVGAHTVDIQTVFALNAAFVSVKPVIVVIEGHGSVYEVVIANNPVAFRTTDLEEGIEKAFLMLVK